MRTLYPSQSSEFDFVVRTSGLACSNASADAVTDWSRVIELALDHRVLPRVWRNAGSLIPQPYAQRIHQHVLRNTQNALQNVQRTVEAVQLLDHEGIAVIVLKGPLLARELYGDYGMRMCNDVDLIVHANDLMRACDVFSNAGFRHHTQLDAASLEHHRKFEHDVAFAHPDDGTLVEVHCAIAQPHYSYRVDLDGWWAARQPVRIAGHELYVLKPEQAYLLAAAHAAKHQWSRLDLISDLAAFQELIVDRDMVYSEAASAGLSRALEIGESLSGYFYGYSTLANDAVVTELVSQLVEGTSFGRWDGAWLDLRTRERFGDRFRYLAGRFVHKPLLSWARKVS